MAITKTVGKIFMSFEAEEKWLNELAEQGWRLIEYNSNELTENSYTFEVDLNARNMRYKIDFRPIKNADEFEEYKVLFEESGWTPIAKNHRAYKYIFISEEGREIYSHNISYIERLQNLRKVKMIQLFTFLAGSLIIAALYFINDSEWALPCLFFFTLVELKFVYTILKCTRSIKQLKQQIG